MSQVEEVSAAPALPPQTRPDWAATFFTDWFGDDRERFTVVSQLLPGLKKNARHRANTPAVLCEAFTELGLDELVYEDGSQWNLYMGVGRMKAAPPRGKKGGKKDVVSVPGVWMDLDVGKAGFFRDENQILDFLRGLAVLPSHVVATGTGGVHAYWRTSNELSAARAEDLTSRWWAYLTAESGVKIDRLTNCDRLMKLPGSIRWPRGVDEPATLVRLLYSSQNTVPASRLEELSSGAWEAYAQRKKAVADKVSYGQLQALQNTGELNSWQMMLALSEIEGRFNETYTWEQVLLPLGWTKLDEDCEGRTIWARPGLKPWELHKSSATNYDGSHVMSLFSDSEDTGLQELDEAGIALTKYRVYVHCVWNGDEAGFVRAYVSEQECEVVERTTLS